MKVTNKDIKELGIDYIETDNTSNVIAMRGKIKPKSKIIFSAITDKNIYWAELQLEYIGG